MNLTKLLDNNALKMMAAQLDYCSTTPGPPSREKADMDLNGGTEAWHRGSPFHSSRTRRAFSFRGTRGTGCRRWA